MTTLGYRVMYQYDWAATRKQLINKPNMWGLVFETHIYADANSALKAWHVHKRFGFCAVSRKVGEETWQIWAMYDATAKADPIVEHRSAPKVTKWSKNVPPPLRHNRHTNKKGNT